MKPSFETMLHLPTDSFPQNARETQPRCRETAAVSGHVVAQCGRELNAGQVPRLEVCGLNAADSWPGI